MEYPIIFSTPMVPPIIADTKIQTRRLTGLDDINKSPEYFKFVRMMKYADSNVRAIFENDKDNSSVYIKSPYGMKGDVLWVRESYCAAFRYEQLFHYKADDPNLAEFKRMGWKWKPSIHMPRLACRLFLRNEGVSIERIQDISEEDCLKEGIDKKRMYIESLSAKESFRKLWNSIHGQWKWSNKKKMFVCYPWSADDIPKIPKGKSILFCKASPNPWTWVVNFSRINDYKK